MPVMKYLILRVLLITSFQVSVASAGIIQYSFSGSVTDITLDTPYLSDPGLAIGDAVNFTIEVDWDKSGHRLSEDGTETIFDDNPSLGVDNGFATVLPDFPYVNTNPTAVCPNCIETINLAANEPQADQIVVGTGSAHFNLAQGDFTQVGSLWFGSKMDWATANNGEVNLTFYHFADLTLNAITPISSVPEPTTLALLGLGLFGLAFIRRKRL